MRVSRFFVIIAGLCMAIGPGMAGAQHAELPDWSGVWGPTANTVFDHATVQPPGAKQTVADAIQQRFDECLGRVVAFERMILTNGCVGALFLEDLLQLSADDASW